jgi:hypothetical protein
MDIDDCCGVGEVCGCYCVANSRALLSMYRSVNKLSRQILESLELAILEVEE